MERWKEILSFKSRPKKLWHHQSSGFHVRRLSESPSKILKERILDARRRLLQQPPEPPPPTDLNPDDLNPSPIGSFPPDSSHTSSKIIETEKENLKQDKYIGIISIHGQLKMQESCEKEQVQDFVNSELQNAIKNFPHYDRFQGRILKVCEETEILPYNVSPNLPEVT